MIAELERQFMLAAGDQLRIAHNVQAGTPSIDTWFDYYAVAAIFLGHLLQANGATLDGIVRAAITAEVERCLSTGSTESGHCNHCDEDFSGHTERIANPNGAWLAEFFAALTVEALWRGRDDEAARTGPSWFSDHERPKIGPCEWCECTEPHDRQPDENESAEYCRNGFHGCRFYKPRLVVPAIRIGGQ